MFDSVKYNRLGLVFSSDFFNGEHILEKYCVDVNDVAAKKAYRTFGILFCFVCVDIFTNGFSLYHKISLGRNEPQYILYISSVSVSSFLYVLLSSYC